MASRGNSDFIKMDPYIPDTKRPAPKPEVHGQRKRITSAAFSPICGTPGHPLTGLFNATEILSVKKENTLHA